MYLAQAESIVEGKFLRSLLFDALTDTACRHRTHVASLFITVPLVDHLQPLIPSQH